jgi:TRAP-type C4-dicarboxylate transport system substrate-binding protein
MQKLTLAMAIMVLTFAAVPADAAEEWNLASRLPAKVFHEANLAQFVTEVTEATGGELKITVHNAASLFKHPEIKPAVQTGQVEMGTLQLSSFANEDELYNFATIPFMATTYDEVRLLWKVARPYIEKRLMKNGIRVLYAVPWPPQAFYATKKLNAVADLKDVKFRTYNRIGSHIAELLGAQPVLVKASEVPQAFATGMVSAMVTSSAFGASIQAWDFVEYYNDTRAWLGLDELVVNESAFQRLSPKVQKAVLDAAARGEQRGWKMSEEANETAKQELAKNGITLVTPSDAFMNAARKAAAPMVDEWVAAAGADAKAIVDEYNKLRKK